MATHGVLDSFEPKKEDWESYTEQLEQYFVANDVQVAAKQRAILLSVSGAQTYQLIRNLVAPRKPTDCYFRELVDMVQAHHRPKPSVIIQRFTFNTRVQKEGETIANFVAELRRLTEHCDFGATLNDMLRDWIVCGIRDASLQHRLLAEPELTFKKAFDLCQAAESAAKNVRELQAAQPKVREDPVMVVKTQASSMEHS